MAEPMFDSFEEAVNFNKKKDDDGGIPFFSRKPVNIAAKGEQPEYETLDWVTIRIKGDNKTVIERQVSERDIARWPDAYDRFKSGQERAVEGFPIEMWAHLEPSMVQTLKSHNLYSVEDVAGMRDGAASKVPMGSQLRTAAKKFLAYREGIDEEKEQMKVQMAEMQKQLDALTADQPKKRGPGRPRKEATTE